MKNSIPPTLYYLQMDWQNKNKTKKMVIAVLHSSHMTVILSSSFTNWFNILKINHLNRYTLCYQSTYPPKYHHRIQKSIITCISFCQIPSAYLSFHLNMYHKTSAAAAAAATIVNKEEVVIQISILNI